MPISNELDKAQKGLLATVLSLADYTTSKNGQLVSQFHEKVHISKLACFYQFQFAPLTNVIVNGIYWDESIPRFLTKDQARELTKTAETTLYSIADISCDINGGVEFTSKATSIEKPFFYYDPISMSAKDSYSKAKTHLLNICLELQIILISK